MAKLSHLYVAVIANKPAERYTLNFNCLAACSELWRLKSNKIVV